MQIEPGTKVEVYLHFGKTAREGRNVYSVRSIETGRVIGHTSTLNLSNVKFVVCPAGRARVLRERRKNVHAWIRGTTTTDVTPVISVWYDPYHTESFATRDDNQPVTTAPAAALRPESVYVAHSGGSQ